MPLTSYSLAPYIPFFFCNHAYIYRAQAWRISGICPSTDPAAMNACIIFHVTLLISSTNIEHGCTCCVMRFYSISPTIPSAVLRASAACE